MPGLVVEELKPDCRELMLDDPKRVARARRTLGSMSDFMKHLKQPVARRANLEDDCTGHFFEQRFYSGALLTEEALIAAMAYVDLNPVRAELAERIGEIRDTSICDRLQENSVEALEDYLRPVLSGLDRRPAAPDVSPSVVAVVGSPVAGSTATPDPRETAAGRQPDGDGGGPGPEHRCDAGTEEAEAEPTATSPAREPGPADRRGRTAEETAPPPHVGAVHRTRPPHGRGGDSACRQHPRPGQAVAGADEGSLQAATRLRQRIRAAVVDHRPGPPASGDPLPA